MIIRGCSDPQRKKLSTTLMEMLSGKPYTKGLELLGRSANRKAVASILRYHKLEKLLARSQEIPFIHYYHVVLRWREHSTIPRSHHLPSLIMAISIGETPGIQQQPNEVSSIAWKHHHLHCRHLRHAPPLSCHYPSDSLHLQTHWRNFEWSLSRDECVCGGIISVLTDHDEQVL